MQVHALKLYSLLGLTPASSRHLAEALCSKLKLNYLSLCAMNPDEEFYSKLRTKASSLQVQTLELILVWCPTRASLHYLAEALCSMPNLSKLTLFGGDLTDKFWSILKTKAPNIQGSFPQIRKGNFKFNEVVQDDLNSFLHTLACPQRLFDSDCSSDSDGPADLGNSNDYDNSANSGNSNVTQFHNIPDQSTFTSPVQPLSGGYHGNKYNMRNASEQSRAMYQETMASTSGVNLVHANISGTPDTLPRGLGANIPVLQESQDNALVRQPLQQQGTLRNQSGIWPVCFENNALPWNTGPSQSQFMPYDLQSGMSAGYHTPAPYQPFSGYYYNPEYREASNNPTYHATLSSSAPSPNPPVPGLGQPTMFAGYLPQTQYQPLVPESTCATHTIMPWSSQDHYRASTSSYTQLCKPPVSLQSAMLRQHISEELFQPMVKEQARSSIPQPSQDHSTTGLHSAPKDQPIVQDRTGLHIKFGLEKRFRCNFLQSVCKSPQEKHPNSRGSDLDVVCPCVPVTLVYINGPIVGPIWVPRGPIWAKWVQSGPPIWGPSITRVQIAGPHKGPIWDPSGPSGPSGQEMGWPIWAKWASPVITR
eukprot:XP_011683561.1 PREDICTED: uncharacterized protein LOC105447349 [Strongylocentrotus purpuratus]